MNCLKRGVSTCFASTVGALLVGLSSGLGAGLDGPPTPWPSTIRESHPWAYWWWMGSAVDKTNLTRELERYQQAGMGGVHIIPIYGAKGFEDKYIDYLSPTWMEMLDHSVKEANRLGLGVDMTTGTGWCFGGPRVTDLEANASLAPRVFQIQEGQQITETFDAKALQALVAFSSNGSLEDLSGRVSEAGTVDWAAPSGTWQVYAVVQRPSGQKVKRAAPGGQGHMLNLFYPDALQNYLGHFDQKFDSYRGAKPRAMYHDSYEYRSEWAPNLFAAFQRRRGYKLESELPALLSGHRAVGTNQAPKSFLDADHIARVKSDYRETLSDLIAEESLPLWSTWARRHGFLTRNEAHGSPGNWLDLYSQADIPETEMFFKDRSKLVSKFASSAAHVAGRNLVSAETGTWLAEHFTETLADMKFLVDDLFLTGVNHVFYHGTCYSPDEAPWPGWLFYASYEMNPRNSVWRDVPALNAYITRCQSILQSGRPDNDVLLYWPIHDSWHDSAGLARNLTVHGRDWLEERPIGKTAERLWTRGYAFDYISDRQVIAAEMKARQLRTPGAAYRCIVVPPTEHMPLETLRKLLALAQAGATVIFEQHLPKDVPGWGDLAQRRAELQQLRLQIRFKEVRDGTQQARFGSGRILVGDLEAALSQANVHREPMFNRTGVMCVRRTVDDGWFYFIANRSSEEVNQWMPLAREARHLLIMDPITGQFGTAEVLRKRVPGGVSASGTYLRLDPGQSIILHLSNRKFTRSPAWQFWRPAGPAAEVETAWHGAFLQGGPELPQPFGMSRLASWTTLPDTNAQRFAGTAVYKTEFDMPGTGHEGPWRLNLGTVCQSARVRLNGEDLGTLFTPPFALIATRLKPKSNLLEVEVTSVAANRIRDLDRRKVNWKTFHDINLVGVDYKPFDASNWPLRDCGLLGPVTLTPVKPFTP